MARAPRILLVNPPIYDFAAYDFWVKPYGLLSVAGYLRGKAEIALFDYLDRLHPFCAGREGRESDSWGRGRFYFEKIPHPACLKNIPRSFRRFGLPRTVFQDFLDGHKSYDFVLVNTVMTYWYLGVQEVIDDIRRACPTAKVILGGNYVTLCRSHAGKLGADFLVEGNNLEPLWDFIGLEPDSTSSPQPDLNQPGLWEAYNRLNVGVLKLSDGCPFECTYCLVPKVYGKFRARPLQRSLAELELLIKLRARDIAFYDDALLFDAKDVLVPFLNEVLNRGITINFHSPNAINARFVTKGIAGLMIRAGFKTFYLGFESTSRDWQRLTGSKVFSEELAIAVENLKLAGAEPNNITAYQILGHPKTDVADLEESMRFVHRLGIRGMLADFSPIPGTPDGEYCRKWVDMDEPLFHNKAAFPIILLGFDETNRLKDLQRRLNRILC
ncbi:MAG: radical SAM protein [Sedimentisphaerales bacterium]|nr:radical SAM protein [Sedimentisphaerales bacterium]